MTSGLQEIREPLLKRPFDFLLASVGLAVSAPLWIAISLGIYLEDRGTVLFTQERCGRNGECFRHIKFRTMRMPARETPTHRVVDMEHDPRVTKIGELLRGTALDELPQLINILRGDMSFVGPRPLPFQIEVESPYRSIAEVPGYQIRSRVRPGVTGLAQVCAPNGADHRQKFRYDSVYVRNMSFWLDLRLIVVSFRVTFRGGWERRRNKV